MIRRGVRPRQCRSADPRTIKGEEKEKDEMAVESGVEDEKTQTSRMAVGRDERGREGGRETVYGSGR